MYCLRHRPDTVSPAHGPTRRGAYRVTRQNCWLTTQTNALIPALLHELSRQLVTFIPWKEHTAVRDRFGPQGVQCSNLLIVVCLVACSWLKTKASRPGRLSRDCKMFETSHIICFDHPVSLDRCVNRQANHNTAFAAVKQGDWRHSRDLAILQAVWHVAETIAYPRPFLHMRSAIHVS